MPLDDSLVGSSLPPTPPYAVTAEAVADFAAATGGRHVGGPAPATFPIVLAFEAMQAFLDAEGLDLHRIVHGEQRFDYRRPVLVGDTLTATLTVSSLRRIGGNDIIGTTSTLTDEAGELVCTASATLVYRGEEEQA
ncbi:FAS1-like dehydratase domain-containing protein [Nocardioides campestrisoli]|uniref:FAS1-like dehydratase domain-containing protein n=1 Tax=Nocardioides campestrisoli TaxID=2736757 RepID=UPI0015E79C91|nr:MaoC family dehydratase N-terminal domain-containing protein [Nocardioides campestrisoli]